MRTSDSKTYLEKKSFFDNILTIYGRNAVLEVLEDRSIEIHKLHLSNSNKPAKVLTRMLALAKECAIEVAYHDKQSLSRISKNSKQDQGVALDIVVPHSGSVDLFLAEHDSYRIIALDGVTNPQNLGMIIRSCAAGTIDAILIPSRGNAQISPLVIKASAGTLFKIPILKTENLGDTLKMMQKEGASLYTLTSEAAQSYRDEHYSAQSVFVLGNESEGVSQEIRTLCDHTVSIPMHRGVESLNVAVIASLLAFMD